jgi:hypothetical protein
LAGLIGGQFLQAANNPFDGYLQSDYYFLSYSGGTSFAPSNTSDVTIDAKVGGHTLSFNVDTGSRGLYGRFGDDFVLGANPYAGEVQLTSSGRVSTGTWSLITVDFDVTDKNGNSTTGNSAKKSKRTLSSTKEVRFVKTEMGMFYLTKPDNPHPSTFPPGVKERICIDFTCKGQECLVNPFPLKKPCCPKGMDKADVEALALHFKRYKSGWLRGYHFKPCGLSPEADTMLGYHTGKKGASKPC